MSDKTVAQTTTPQVAAPETAAPESSTPSSNADLNAWLAHAQATGDGFTADVIGRWFDLVDATGIAGEACARLQQAAQEADPTYLDGAVRELEAAAPEIGFFRSLYCDLKGTKNTADPDKAATAQAVCGQMERSGGFLLPFWLEAASTGQVTDVQGLVLAPPIPQSGLVIDNLAADGVLPAPRNLASWAASQREALEEPIRVARWARRSFASEAEGIESFDKLEQIAADNGASALRYDGQRQFVATHAQLAGAPDELVYALDNRAEMFSDILLAAANGEDVMALAPEGEAPWWFENAMDEVSILQDGLLGLDRVLAELPAALDAGDVAAAQPLLEDTLAESLVSLNRVRGVVRYVISHWDETDSEYRWADLARTAFEPYRAWSYDATRAVPDAARLVTAGGQVLGTPTRRAALPIWADARLVGLHLPEDGVGWARERAAELVPAVAAAAALDGASALFEEEEAEEDDVGMFGDVDASWRKADQVQDLKDRIGWEGLSGAQRLYVGAHAVARGLPDTAIGFFQEASVEAMDQAICAWSIRPDDFATLDEHIGALEHASATHKNDEKILGIFRRILSLARESAEHGDLTPVQAENEYLNYVFRRMTTNGTAERLFDAVQLGSFHAVNRYWQRTGRFPKKDTFDTVTDAVVGGQQDLWGQGESTGERLSNGAATLGRNFGAASLGVGWGVVQSVPVLGGLADGAFHEDVDALVVDLMMPGATQEDHDLLLPMVRSMNTAGAIYGTILTGRIAPQGAPAWRQQLDVGMKGAAATQSLGEAAAGQKIQNLTAPSAADTDDPHLKARRRAYEKGNRLSDGQRMLSGLLGVSGALGTANTAAERGMIDPSKLNKLDDLTGVDKSLSLANDAVGTVANTAALTDEAVKTAQGKGSALGMLGARDRLTGLGDNVSNLRRRRQGE